MDLSMICRVLSGDPKNTDFYSNKIFEDTKLLPTECYLINDKKDLFLKFRRGEGPQNIKNAENLNKLKNIGLEIKLTPDQSEKQTIFVNSAPISILETDPKDLLDEINKDNPNIVALSLYAPPTKSYGQRLTNIKITLASRIMVNSCFKYGLKIKGCFIDPLKIKQGQYLKVPQCNKCCNYHQIGQCIRTCPICAICGGPHEKYSCKNENSRPYCNNCRGPHRATSNLCPIRREHLTDDYIPDTKEYPGSIFTTTTS